MTLVELLPVIIYFLLIILLVIGIILGIKLIISIDKINYLVDDVTKKVKSLDYVFSMFDLVSNKLVFISERVISFITGLIGKISNLKNKKEEDDFNE